MTTPSDLHDVSIVGILGTSFSGSTLLNLMLGAHPSIYAGGELSALILNKDDPAVASCTACGTACRYWTAQERSAITKANLYRNVVRIFGKPIIVDSSKSIDWFSEVLASSEHAGCVPHYVLMVKHPIRYLASCTANMTGDHSHSRLTGFFKKRARQQEREEFLTEQIDVLAAFYDGFFAAFGKKIGRATFHLVHYERLVAAPRTILVPLLRSLSLDHSPGMDDFFRAEFHQIGGNAGPLYQAGHGWPVGHEPARHRKAFYEAGAALRIDDKYRQCFTDEELARLKGNGVLRRLCDNLGYDAAAMPFPIQIDPSLKHRIL
jgi:hypothetical protein